MKREAEEKRITNETSVFIRLSLDEKTNNTVNTGIGFFDHMLDLFAFHSGFTLSVACEGDLVVDDHHSVEDVGLALGSAFKKALLDKKGIKRYGVSYVPMDEALSRVVTDISNRGVLVFNASFKRESIKEFATENVKEFFKAFVMAAQITLHIETLYGENDHHKIESIFKAFGQSLKAAVSVVGEVLPSTKGVL